MKSTKLTISVLLILLVTVFFTTGCKQEQQGQAQYVHVGPNWAAVHNLEPSDKNFQVQLKGKQTLTDGQAIQFSIKSAKAGQVWVVQVDPNDEMTLLFPNEISTDNQISADTWFQVPPAGAGYEILAGHPYGQSTLAAVVTTGETDINDVLAAQKSMAKALILIEDQPFWGIGHIVVDVKEK